MLGSHNSLSYLPIQGWRKVLKPWAKCQSLTLEEQYEKGVRYFDLRVRKDKYGLWWYCHNNAIFVPVIEHKEVVDFLTDKQVKVRVILDVRKKPKDAEDYKTEFLSLITEFFHNKVYVDSAIVYWEWHEYLIRSVKQYEYHVSVSAPWYKYIFGTKWFAKLYNKKYFDGNKEILESKDEVILLDYIQFK